MKKKKRRKSISEIIPQTPPGTLWIPDVGMKYVKEVKVDKEKEQEIVVFCKNPKWNIVLQDITHLVSEYERLKTELSEAKYPLDSGIFRLEVHYGGGRKMYVLFVAEKAIYDFSYSREMLPDQQSVSEAESEGPERTFYGVKGTGGKPARFGLVTRVNDVDWKSVFHLEGFLREIKYVVADLEVRWTDQQIHYEESARNFEDYIESAAELLNDE